MLSSWNCLVCVHRARFWAIPDGIVPSPSLDLRQQGLSVSPSVTFGDTSPRTGRPLRSGFSPDEIISRQPVYIRTKISIRVPKREWTIKMEFVIVTGVSGSGKSCAADVLEDIGYFCIDNMPPQLIPKFAELCGENSSIQKVAMVDERVKGYIEIFKTDSETKKAIKGVTFELRGSDGKVIETLKTDKDGYARSQDLDICTYKENGEFDKNIEYTVVETKAAKGYILDKKEHKVVLEYTGNVKSSIPYQLKLTNKPKEPKLPQTGGNYHAWMFILLGGLIFIAGLHSIRKRKG